MNFFAKHTNFMSRYVIQLLRNGLERNGKVDEVKLHLDQLMKFKKKKKKLFRINQIFHYHRFSLSSGAHTFSDPLISAGILRDL
jgi:hypothetical protein